MTTNLTSIEICLYRAAYNYSIGTSIPEGAARAYFRWMNLALVQGWTVPELKALPAEILCRAFDWCLLVLTEMMHAKLLHEIWYFDPHQGNFLLRTPPFIPI
jgi:hypothetical protein